MKNRYVDGRENRFVFSFISLSLNLNLNVSCNATNRRNVYFSRFPQILEFSRISKTQKRVHECIYHPTPCIYFIRSRVGAYVRVHTCIRVPV